MRRDDWLRMSDDDLLRACEEQRYKASGPGGQRRNKVETAVRLRHGATGVTVQASESRSLAENRTSAVRRLRERIAFDVRAPFDPAGNQAPSELREARKGESLAISTRHATYPIVAAVALDALQACEGSYARAADALGISTSQLLKFLRRDAELWRAAEQLRKADSALASSE